MQVLEFASTLGLVLAQPVIKLASLIANPLSGLSGASMLSALVISATFLVVTRAPGKRIKAAVLARALLPRRWFRTRSARADMGMTLFNTLLGGTLLGWAIVSASLIERTVSGALGAIWGAQPLIGVPHAAMLALLMTATWLAFEAAYFVDHYLKHHVPVLWHFHRVHHSAETLSPLTNFRVHPVDSVIFYNIAAVAIGVTAALCRQVFGTTDGSVVLAEVNLILLAAKFLITHLQHSHMWIAFTGPLGRWILSPAHHQIHHSTDPRHFNRNLGYTLAVFDRWAGTLVVPTARRERLEFGSGDHGYDPHGVSGLMIMPFADAATEVTKPKTKTTEDAPVVSLSG